MGRYNEGLTEKYTVTRNDTGENVPGVFVLRPESDPVAAAALLHYADIVSIITNNSSPLLAEVEMWLQSVDNLDGTGAMYDAGVKLYNRLFNEWGCSSDTT